VNDLTPTIGRQATPRPINEHVNVIILFLEMLKKFYRDQSNEFQPAKIMGLARR